MLTNPEKIHELLETKILTRVSQPGQYIGNEIGCVKKIADSAEVSLALCFPDTYSIGMSHLGYQILYDIVNSKEWAMAERAYAPWIDMQKQMQEHGIPLFTVESFTPVRNFDILGFTLQSELLYSNILLMLDMAGMELLGSDRSCEDPLVIAGGPGALAPEPLADFIDVFFAGDAEESLPRFLNLVRKSKTEGAGRDQILHEAAKTITGIYVPKLYRPFYGNDGLLSGIEPVKDDLPAQVRAAVLKDLDNAPFPVTPIVPNVETTQERITLEIMRGCGRGCRFCHAGMTHRPQRYRSPDTLFKQAVECYQNTGYDEIALCSLSSSDYPHLQDLLKKLTDYFTPLSVSVSLPSLRVSEHIEQLVGPLNAVRKSGLTLAPEAATQRLRDIIKKNITDRDLYDGTAAAVEAGWRTIKLYFMVGLPDEGAEDIDAIGALCNAVIDNVRKKTGKKSLSLNVTVSPFVPKPHTPMQWEPMQTVDAMEKKWKKIRITGGKKIKFKWHNPEQSMVEAVLARGDRRAGEVLRDAYIKGAQFDAWNDSFDFSIWEQTLKAHGILNDKGQPSDHHNSPFRLRTEEECMPWDHVSCGAEKDFLLKERRRAFEGKMKNSTV